MLFARAYRTRAVGLFLLALLLTHGPAILRAAPVTSGLVLWLDAHDSGTLSPQPGGAICLWDDKSGQGNHAKQADPDRQPHRVPDGFQGKPAVRFDGNDFLNLGRPASLDFRPGDPFTIVVVSRVARQDSGTFLSKGGGAAGQRAYQFYVAPGRLGAVTYGVMQEKPRTSDVAIAIEVCDGSQADVHVNGTSRFSFRVGGGTSQADVLIGARRHNTDNTGTYYLLQGDVAELLVYNRALKPDERRQLGRHLMQKHGLQSVYTDPGDVEKLVSVLATPEAAAGLDALAASLVQADQSAAPEIRALLEKQPAAAPLVAELLVRIAENNRLSSPLAEIAAELLRHDDPFVHGLAEWALALKVGGENNGQEARWPQADQPPWYREWSGLSPTFRLEADWVRQAVAREIQRDPAKLAASVDEMVRRAERMRADWANAGVEADRLATVDEPLAQLRQLRDQCSNRINSTAEDLVSVRRLWIEARRLLRSIVLANPAVDFEGIVFVKQFAPHTVRNITRSYAWKHKPGGDICVLADLKAGGPARGVLQGRLGPGYVWGLDLWWDADRVVFGYARQPNWPPAVDTANYAIEGTNVFPLRQQHEPLHLFEARLDGSDPRQLTDHPYWSDFEPTYCASGDVVFASDRCGRSAECGNDTYDHTNPNLYFLSADGSKVQKWTDSKDIDRYPHSLDDGRIAYTHWEYQERHFMEVHALWTARPDGTMSDALFKHHMPAPCGLRDTRSIPGSNKLVSIATGHHTFAYGPVVIVDPAAGMNDEAGLQIVTPGVLPQEGPMAGRPVAGGGVPDRGGLYQTPWALSEKCFLVGYAYARPNCTAPAGADSNGFGIYLIDVYGNRELIHRDPLLSCAFPIPLKRRPRPPIVPDVRIGSELVAKSGGQAMVPTSRAPSCPTPAVAGPLVVAGLPTEPPVRPKVSKCRGDLRSTKTAGSGDPRRASAPTPPHCPDSGESSYCDTEANGDATCYVADVYHGMEGVPRGTVRHLRISQHVGWPFDAKRGQMDYIPGNAGSRRIDFQSWSPVRVIGTVPVASDGSASFKVPADTALYFQALDERHMEVRRMRSMVSFKAGEVRGCTGCHESRGWTATSDLSMPEAMRREPDRPSPPPWGSERLLGYEWLVQPILEKHCVRCHGQNDPDGGCDLTATRAADGLYQSFRTLFGRRPDGEQTGRLLVSCSDRFSNAEVSQPKQFGSHKSPLVRVLLDDSLHRDEVQLNNREWISLVTWVDANAPYHDAFLNKRPTGGGQPKREVTCHPTH